MGSSLATDVRCQLLPFQWATPAGPYAQMLFADSALAPSRTPPLTLIQRCPLKCIVPSAGLNGAPKTQTSLLVMARPVPMSWYLTDLS